MRSNKKRRQSNGSLLKEKAKTKSKLFKLKEKASLERQKCEANIFGKKTDETQSQETAKKRVEQVS